MTDAFWQDIREEMAADPEYAAMHVKAAMELLDGTDVSRVSLITGLTPDEIEELGGLS